MSQQMKYGEENCLNGESRNVVAGQLNFKRLDNDDEGQQDDRFHQLMEESQRVSLEAENKENMEWRVNQRMESKRNAVGKEIAANEKTDQRMESKRSAVGQVIDVSEDIVPRMESKINTVDSMNAGRANSKLLVKRHTRHDNDSSCVTIPTRKTEMICIFVNYCFNITYIEYEVHCEKD